MPIRSYSLTDLAQQLYPLRSQLMYSNIVLSVNYFRLGIPSFSFSELLSFFFEQYQINQLAFQTYSEFSDRSHRSFSRFSTPVTPYLSSISKQSFAHSPHNRLLSPTHSFVCYGASSDTLCKVFTSAFGSNSVFAYFTNADFSWLNLGSFLTETCTYIHHVEASLSDFIPYRSNIVFPVRIYPELSPHESYLVDYEYFSSSSSYSNLTFDWSPLYNLDSIHECDFTYDVPVSLYPLKLLFSVSKSLIADNPFVFTSSTG